MNDVTREAMNDIFRKRWPSAVKRLERDGGADAWPDQLDGYTHALRRHSLHHVDTACRWLWEGSSATALPKARQIASGAERAADQDKRFSANVERDRTNRLAAEEADTMHFAGGVRNAGMPPLIRQARQAKQAGDWAGFHRGMVGAIEAYIHDPATKDNHLARLQTLCERHGQEVPA